MIGEFEPISKILCVCEYLNSELTLNDRYGEVETNF